VWIVADLQVQVGRFALHGNAKQIINMHSAVLPQTPGSGNAAIWQKGITLRHASQSGFQLIIAARKNTES
jgi:hypothetical protein